MTKRRLPQVPESTNIDVTELAAFDFMQSRIRGAKEAKIGNIDGEAYGVSYFRALANTPIIGEALGRLGQAAMEIPGRPGTLSAADHELADAVIAFDSGYLWLLAGHAPLAIKAGVRLEALEALRSGSEADLTEDEVQQVEFIRAVRDGKVSQDIWDRMVLRLGSERGVIEYAFFVLLVQLNHLLANAMGVPNMTDEELNTLFDKLGEGTEGSYAEYARLYGDAAFRIVGKKDG